jgi:hypothetical protein
MSKPNLTLGLAATAALGLAGAAAYAAPLNGVSDNGTDALGYYYAISGGQFPTGSTPNGDNASGGTRHWLSPGHETPPQGPMFRPPVPCNTQNE